jgi:hypothetical protein
VLFPFCFSYLIFSFFFILHDELRLLGCIGRQMKIECNLSIENLWRKNGVDAVIFFVENLLFEQNYVPVFDLLSGSHVLVGKYLRRIEICQHFMFVLWSFMWSLIARKNFKIVSKYYKMVDEFNPSVACKNHILELK